MAGIYIHIPFCKSRCDYCAFYSTTFGAEVRHRYVERLCREIKERRDYLGTRFVSTVYMGGGTPSQLSGEEMELLFTELRNDFCISADAEITVEVNPDDVTPQYAAMLAANGVNRVSMGVQSFNEDLLQFIHRRHSAAEAVESFETLRNAGIDNISIDLIYAFPHETAEMWADDVAKAVMLRPEHISAYALSFEEGTPLYAKMQKGEVSEADEDVYINMYDYLIDALEAAGYEHYEISNFAHTGRRARHNSSYWRGDSYLGVGAGAHSFDGDSRRADLGDVKAYIAAVDGDVPHVEERLTDAEKYDEMVMTRLRTCEGLCLDDVERIFSKEKRNFLMQNAESYIAEGMLETVDIDGKCFLKLTRSGIFVSDAIFSALMNPD